MLAGPGLVVDDDGADGGLTRAGAVMGTPSFMAPEQARGELDRIGPRTDVFALGGILYAILTGEPPRQGRLDALREVIATEPPPALRWWGRAALRALCRAAMAFEIEARPAHAGVLAVEVRRWLDGARRRAEAREVLAAALRLEPEVGRLRAEAARLEAEAASALDPLAPDAPIDDKRPGWQLEDAASDRRMAARVTELKTWQMFQTAVELDPDFTEARARITDYYRGQVLDAEAAHDRVRATEYAALLEGHDREGNVEWLRGDGRLTLLTDPPGAEVRIHRYESEDRVLVPVPVPTPAPLTTPLVEHPLAMGSYLLTLHAPGRVVVRYPVVIDRLGHWDGIPPGESVAYAIPLPREGEVGAEECYVPAGWFVSGGDAEAVDGLPWARVWVDGFVIGRCSVSNGEYVEFLDAMLAEHGPAEADRWVPREEGRPVMVRAGQGFALSEGDGHVWRPRQPARRISGEMAQRYAEWRASRTGHGWSLPASWQWEKAARGVDGRPFPWGAHFDVTRAAVMYSRSGLAGPVELGSHPFDESPYGLCDVAGNVRDVCGDVYRRQGPPLVGGRFEMPSDEIEPGRQERPFQVVKGGMYHATAPYCRLASRFGMPPSVALSTVGFRLCRRWG
ncbi:MAG: SUMF1/EgtB/PvdO family nonheme iron enzyme [Myxococcales bacterium]|nr:SUMF1/EgtB/PvdO family nonheme iron enzyme [Myxococcales bacterium]